MRAKTILRAKSPKILLGLLLTTTIASVGLNGLFFIIFSNQMASASQESGNIPQNRECRERRSILGKLFGPLECPGRSESDNLCLVWPSVTSRDIHMDIIFRESPTIIWKDWIDISTETPLTLVETLEIHDLSSEDRVFFKDFSDVPFDELPRQYHQGNEQEILARSRGRNGYWKIESYTPSLEIPLIEGHVYQIALNGDEEKGSFTFMESNESLSQIREEFINLSGELIPEVTEYYSSVELEPDELSEAERTILNRLYYLTDEPQNNNHYYVSLGSNWLENPLYAEMVQEIFSISEPSNLFKSHFIFPIEESNSCSP